MSVLSKHHSALFKESSLFYSDRHTSPEPWATARPSWPHYGEGTPVGAGFPPWTMARTHVRGYEMHGKSVSQSIDQIPLKNPHFSRSGSENDHQKCLPNNSNRLYSILER